ncbi:MAG: YbaB/EbfC family nucleoid-associated protein [Clostridia bacterium]|nr:YbaB/EbfC family nucleoid-associated protein [Clostridia bacterium]
MKARIPGAGGMGNIMQQAQKMQEQMQQTQAELEEREYETSAGGGVIKVAINGKKEITKVTIDPSVVDPDDVEMLEDLVAAAVNEAIRTVEDDAAEEMGKITGGLGGLGIPGIM